MSSEDRFIFILKCLIVPIAVSLWDKIYDSYSRPLVLTTNGWVRGIKSQDGDFDMFLGIPYGKVRSENPFGAAEPHPNFADVFDASDNTKNCPQLDEISQTIGGTLDCLNVHIYVPRSRTGKLPVMVYIFGGQLKFGFAGKFLSSSIYRPQHLVRFDVIYVIFNYRLGPYGFMCLGTKDVPGNVGIKDQSMALRWIKDNIESFAGDPDRITLFGHSSGALCVDIHAHHQPFELFQQVILQSGTILCANSIVEPNTTVPLAIADKLGFQTSNVKAAIKYLAKQDPKDVVNASLAVVTDYRPCKETKFEGVKHILTDYAINLEPKAKGRRFIIGHTKEESNMVFAEVPKEFFDDNDVIGPSLLSTFDLNETELEKSVSEVKRYYRGVDKVSGRYKENIVNYTSDLIFNYPLQRVMDRFLNYGADKVYYYIFAYCGSRNFHKVVNNITAEGAMHADELGYIYQPSFYGEADENDQLVIDRMTTLWTNFAKYGDPTPTVSKLITSKWYPISEDSKPYLLIDRHLAMDSELTPRMKFWEAFFRNHENCLKN